MESWIGGTRWRLALLYVLIVLAAPASAEGQPSPAPRPRGYPYDWSHHHLIFSQPRSPETARRLEHDPRYLIQQSWRNRQVRTGSVREYMQSLDLIARQLAATPARNGSGKGKSSKLTGDWSINLGSGAKVGAGRYPAKFSFDPNAAPDCTNDFVVFNTGKPGASSQASVIAFNKLYVNTCAGAPAVYWAYNTGGTITNSVVLSMDGSQIAFIHSGVAASLVILKWKAGQGTSASTPASPNGTTYISTTSPSTFVSCKSNPANACQLNLAFANNNSDTNSSPFADYSNDAIYVGDDIGMVHKFSGVFNGTPAEVLTSPWPAAARTQSVLTSPVLDSGVSPGMIYVGESNPTPPQALDAIDISTGQLTRSTALGRNTVDIADAPIVDSSSGKIYVGVGNDGSGNSAVFLLNRGFNNMTVPSKAPVGTASQTTPLPLYDGAFDNTYFNSASGTGNLYVCGNTGGNPTVYQAPITASGFGTVHAGPALASATTTCAPITEVYNVNASGGPFDWIFTSVQASGSITGCSSSACVMSFVVTAWQSNTAYTLNQTILDSNLNIQKITTAGTSGTTAPVWNTNPNGTTADGTAVWKNQGAMSTSASARVATGGTSGIIIDNTSSATGASQVYYSTLTSATCATSGTSGGCAVQASQAGLQ